MHEAGEASDNEAHALRQGCRGTRLRRRCPAGTGTRRAIRSGRPCWFGRASGRLTRRGALGVPSRAGPGKTASGPRRARWFRTGGPVGMFAAHPNPIQTHGTE